MGRKALFKPAFTCEECKKTIQHNIEFDIVATIDQSEDGQQLLGIKVVGNIICRNCGEKTQVRGLLTKFVNEKI